MLAGAGIPRKGLLERVTTIVRLENGPLHFNHGVAYDIEACFKYNKGGDMLRLWNGSLGGLLIKRQVPLWVR